MDTASTVLKALDTLTILAGHTEGVPIPDLALALNQPRSNVVRLLGSLQTYGLVARDGHAWKVTASFVEWTAPPDRYTVLKTRYRPLLEELAAVTGELVMLGLHEGNGVIHIDYVESESGVHIAPAPMTRHNIRRNALGKLALSRRADLAARYRDDAFQEELEAIRRTGVAWNREETVRGMIAMAMPGFTNAPTEPMLAIAWPKRRFTEESATRAQEVIRSRTREGCPKSVVDQKSVAATDSLLSFAVG